MISTIFCDNVNMVINWHKLPILACTEPYNGGFIRLYNLIATISENTRSFAVLINSGNRVSHMNRAAAGLFFCLDSSGTDYHQSK